MQRRKLAPIESRDLPGITLVLQRLKNGAEKLNSFDGQAVMSSVFLAACLEGKTSNIQVDDGSRFTSFGFCPIAALIRPRGRVREQTEARGIRVIVDVPGPTEALDRPSPTRLLLLQKLHVGQTQTCCPQAKC